MEKSVSKGLNFWMLIALVSGTMIGSGIFTLPANLAAFGSVSLFGWLFTAIGAILLAYIFAKLSLLIPKTGGPYAYCREAFGNFIGFQVAYNYWLALCIGNAAVVVTCVGYFSEFFPILKQQVWVSFGIKVSLIWLLTAINILGVRAASIFQIITLVLKILPLIVIGLVGLFFIQPTYYQAFNVSPVSNFSAVSTSATLALWSFIGLEAATVPAEHVKDKRLIAKATIFGVLLVAIINIITIVAVMGLIPNDVLAQSSAPLATAAKYLFPAYSNVVGGIISIGAIIACLGSLNSVILLQGQIAKASAKDSLFPSSFAKENSYQAPAFGLIISAFVITFVLLFTLNDTLLKQFELMILMATLSSLIPYFLTSLAAIKLVVTRFYTLSTSEKRLIIIVSVLASLYSLWAIFSAGMTTIFYGLIIVLSGIPIYLRMQYTIKRTDKLAIQEE